MEHKLLSIYLNDHLAGSTLGRDLARRTAGSNRDNDYGPPLARLAEEIDADRDSLLALMDTLEVGTDRVKVLGAWVAEKAGRLKLNGRLLSYSPLSRLVELEALLLGVTGKLALWRSLQLGEAKDLQLPKSELKRLVERAERQARELESLRLRAMAEVLEQ
ncbi:MAG TPA: hypothetical protein VGG98_04405 [Solirubrobacteraceae bacterium]|jgi:hypothetical protein